MELSKGWGEGRGPMAAGSLAETRIWLDDRENRRASKKYEDLGDGQEVSGRRGWVWILVFSQLGPQASISIIWEHAGMQGPARQKF